MRGFYFPPMIPQTGAVGQINKVREEFGEFLGAMTSEDLHRQAEELWDHIHALESLSRELANILGPDFWLIRQKVEDKNRVKGLYAEDEG